MSETFTNISNILCCPQCLANLVDGNCTECNTVYEQTLGILDLRWPKPAPLNQTEATLVAKIVEHYPTTTFQELVALRFQDSKLPANIRKDYQHYSSNPQRRSRQMLDMFWERVVEKFVAPDFHMALDMGCGVGASSIALASQYNIVVGIDVDLISLILAQKFLEERDITNVVLVQAYAQKIPLRNRLINYAVAQNVLEHLFDVETALNEVCRVLKTDGCFCGDSRNRYDLLMEEPHAKLRWVGFWPRQWQAWYVWKFRQMSYDHTRLLSLPELNRFAKRVFGDDAFVTFPKSVAYGRSAKWDTFINIISRIPIINWLSLFFFPSHLLVAQNRRNR